MTMPKWHETMRPVLEALDKASGLLKGADLMQAVAQTFDMTDEERAERLKSGQLRLYNRVYWGITDLEKAKLLEYGAKRGTYLITDAGREFLAIHDGPITANVLYDNCESFKKWKDDYHAASKGKGKVADAVSGDGEQVSPQEAMDASYSQLREALADELITAVYQMDPYAFEHLVGTVLERMGYGESVVTKKSGDEGIDGIVKGDRLGFDMIYYQAKRHSPESSIGRPAIQEFSGALDTKSSTKGLFITTARFSEPAREYAEALPHKRIVLVDGRSLANLMIDYGIGVSTRVTYEVKSIDTDFFEE